MSLIAEAGEGIMRESGARLVRACAGVAPLGGRTPPVPLRGTMARSAPGSLRGRGRPRAPVLSRSARADARVCRFSWEPWTGSHTLPRRTPPGKARLRPRVAPPRRRPRPPARRACVSLNICLVQSWPSSTSPAPCNGSSKLPEREQTPPEQKQARRAGGRERSRGGVEFAHRASALGCQRIRDAARERPSREPRRA